MFECRYVSLRWKGVPAVVELCSQMNQDCRPRRSFLLGGHVLDDALDAALRDDRLVDLLDEDDDVQDVYANFDIPDEVLENL